MKVGGVGGRIAGAALLGLALLPGAGAAQTRGLRITQQRAFTFLGSSLTIEVTAAAPGTVQLIHGQAGQVEVTARAQDGFAGFGLADTREQLTLTSAGATRVQYLVVVPADASVRVRLPGHESAETFGTLEHTVSYSWQPPRPAGSSFGEGMGDGEAESASAGALQPAYVAGVPPAVVSASDGSNLRALTVRWQGRRFEVLTSRPVLVAPANGARLELPRFLAPTSVVIQLPAAAHDFRLELQGRPALVISGGHARVPCSSAVEQTLSGGRRWFTFSAGPNGVVCGPGGR